MLCITDGKTLSVPASAKPIIDSLGGKPLVINDEIKSAALLTIDRIDIHNEPCGREWLKGAIFTLLQHFYIRELPDEVQEAIARDWLDVVGKFPQWAIEGARIEYLSESDRKPTPKNIYDLCVKAMNKNSKLYWKCKEIVRTPIEEKRETTPEDRENAINDVRELLKDIF